MEVSAKNGLHNNSIHSLKFMNNEIITINEYGKAIHDYYGRAEDELTFEEEDVILLTLKDETGDWVFGELNGSRGWFPSSNIRVLTEKECANEGLTWPPQSLLSYKSSFLNSSSLGGRNRCNSKDSFNSVSSNSINHVIIPTANEDNSNPTLPTPQVRSWYSKYQQIKRYQSKRNNIITPSKLGTSVVNNQPLAASNSSEKIAISEVDKRETVISPASLEAKSYLPEINVEEKLDNSQPEAVQAEGEKEKENNKSNSEINNESNEEKKKEPDLTKEYSDDEFSNEKFINEVANILNSPTSKYIGLDERLFKEENESSIDNICVGNTGSIQEFPKNIDNISNSRTSISSTTPIQHSNSARTSLSISVKDVNIESRKGSHHSSKISQATTPTRVIHRVTTPTVSRQKWSDFVSNSTIQNLSKKEVQRQEVMFEMINTERDYLKDLDIVMDIYIDPMKKQKIIRQKDIDVIFSDWENILLVHKEIMKRLEDRQKQGYVINEIGDIWIQMSDYLKVYTMYCSNHPYALIKLQILSRNKNFTKFLESRLQLPESRNLNLANFLLKPVQRICKYPLLLREIIKNTDEDHPDYKNLVSALFKIETVITIINDAAKQTEGVHKLLELQQRFTTKVNIIANLRTIIHKSEIDIIEKRLNSYDRKRRQMYLLNDMVLIARSSSTGPDSLNTGKLKLLAMISTKEILVKDLEDSPYLKNTFELVHTGKQSYRIAVDTPMNKEVWLKMLNNVILDDIQSNKVENVTAMKPSVETTYRSLNGKKNLKNISPTTPDYRLATLKFNDSSMIKEVEKEFNRINCQNIFMTDNDDESIKDDEKSISSIDTDDNVTSNVHLSTLEMPSISEEVDDNKKDSPVPNDDTEEKEDQKEENNDVGKQRYSTNKKNIKENDEKEEEESESGSPIPIVEENDIFKVNVIRHGSHSLVDFEGIRDYYSDDDAKSLSRKRYSFPLTIVQSKNINVKDSIFKGKSESPVLPELDESSNKVDEVVKEDNVSVSIKSSNDSIQDSTEKKNKNDEKEENANIDKENVVNNDRKVSSGENEIDKNSIIPLNDMLEDTPNNDDKEDVEVDIVSPISNNTKFNSKSCDSLENIKKHTSISSETKSPINKSEQEETNKSKSSDSIHIHESTSSDSLVINEKGDDSFIASSENISSNNLSSQMNTLNTMNLSADNLTRINNDSEDFSFSRIRNKFGGTSNGSDITLIDRTIEENNSRKEELKNIILPSKIHNTPTYRKRGLMINTLFEENKAPNCDSPTRFIYDISKNPFIIKDMSTHKSKNTKATDNDPKKLQHTLNLGGNKVSSIQKEFFSKDNKKPEVTSPDKKKMAKSPLAKEIQPSDDSIKSPLSKEVQFSEPTSSSTKSDENRKSKSVKFGNIITMDNGLSPASCCVNSKRSSYNKSPTATSSPTFALLSPTSLTNSNISVASNSSISITSTSNSVTNSTSNIRNTPSKETGSKPNITKSSSNINRPVNEAKIVDVEIVCIESSKKYVYVIEVDRGLSDIYNVRHTYDDFFDLHLQLIGNFPEEAGVSVGFSKHNSVTRRIIPDLPAQMMFVSEAIARSRISRLQEYINTILKLPGKISKHPLVMNFFKTDGKWSTSGGSIKKP